MGRQRRLPVQTTSSQQKQQQQQLQRQKSYRRSTLESDSLFAARSEDDSEDDDDNDEEETPPPTKTRRGPSLATKRRVVVDDDDSGSELDDTVPLDKENEKGANNKNAKTRASERDSGIEKGVLNDTVKDEASSDDDESASSSLLSVNSMNSTKICRNKGNHHHPGLVQNGTTQAVVSQAPADVSDGNDASLSTDNDLHDSYDSDEQSGSSTNGSSDGQSVTTDESSAYEPGQDETVHWSIASTAHHHDDDPFSSEKQTLPGLVSKREGGGYRAKILAATQTTFVPSSDDDDDSSNDDDDDLDPDLVIDDQDELRFARSSVPNPTLRMHQQLDGNTANGVPGSQNVISSACLGIPQIDASSTKDTDSNNYKVDCNPYVPTRETHDTTRNPTQVTETEAELPVHSLSDHTSVSYVNSGGSVVTHGTKEMEGHDDETNERDDDDDITIEDYDTVAREKTKQSSGFNRSQRGRLRSDMASTLPTPNDHRHVRPVEVEAVDDEADEGSDCSSYDEVVAELIDTDAEPEEVTNVVNRLAKLPSPPPSPPGNCSDILAATVDTNDTGAKRRPPTEITVSYYDSNNSNGGGGGGGIVPMSPLMDECFRSESHASPMVENNNNQPCQSDHETRLIGVLLEDIDGDDAVSVSLVQQADKEMQDNKSSNSRPTSPTIGCQKFNNQASSVVDASEMSIKRWSNSICESDPSCRKDFESPLRCDRSRCDTNIESMDTAGRNAVSIGTQVAPHVSTPQTALEISVLCKSMGTLSIDQSLTYSPVPTVDLQSDFNVLNKDRTKPSTTSLGQTNSGGDTNQSAHQPVKPKGRRFRREGSIKRGKWKFGAKIGSGAFGVVHVGMNTETGAFIAIKSLKMEPSVMKDAEREVDLLKSLRHENIVRYLGAEMDSKNLHIFQEWVPGGSVDSMLAKFGPFPLVVLRNYLEQILRGIQYLHGSNIMHRDIKGSNILVNDEGIVKLADFGAGKRFQQLKCDMMMSLTMRGTPYFMAPEVFQEKYSTKADIWSVACVAVQMATGSPPWKKLGFTNPVSLFQHMTTTTHVPGVEFDGSVGLLEGSPQVALFTNVLESCFLRQPENRPNAHTLLADVFFTSESNISLDDMSECRGLFSPESRGSTFCISPVRGSLSPMRPPTRRRNSVASSPPLRCFSPPLPRNTTKKAAQSPSASPSCDSTDWPIWARHQLPHIADGGFIQKSTVNGQHALKDSLEYSDDSSDRQLGSHTSLVGLKLASTYTQPSP